MERFDFSIFKNLWLAVGAEVGATTYYSEIAMLQTLDNLRAEGTIDIIEYLERVPEKLIPRKAELIDELKQKAVQGEAMENESKPVHNTGGISEGLTSQTYDNVPKATREILRKKLGL